MKLLHMITLTFTLSMMLSASAYAKDGRAKISLFPESDSLYVTSSSDPWMTESWETSLSNFKLDVESLTKTNPVYMAQLVLSIPFDTPASSWSFTLGSQSFNYASFSNSGDHPYLSSHGVFGGANGALWTEYSLGTINPGQILSLDFAGNQMPVGMRLHFDAYGSGSPAAQNGWYFSPYSHDVTKTVTPEPVSAILFLAGSLGLGAHCWSRAKKKSDF